MFLFYYMLLVIIYSGLAGYFKEMSYLRSLGINQSIMQFSVRFGDISFHVKIFDKISELPLEHQDLDMYCFGCKWTRCENKVGKKMKKMKRKEEEVIM